MVHEPHARSSSTDAATSFAARDGAVDLARDRELVEACQDGDEAAFAELYSRYHRRLLRFCVRRLHATDDAEEAVQEAFTRAWRALPRFGGDKRFYPWLTVIAGNVCTDMLRRRSRLVPLDEVQVSAGDGAALESDVDERLLRQVDLAMASEALGHLSDRHQRVLRLREATEWTSQRIAEHEGVAVPAVDTLLWRARQAFKREFAALSDAGGLAAAVGVGVAALRRAIGRAGTRMATLAAFPTRSPGALVATVAITGAAVAGGGAAFVSATSHPGAPARLSASAPAAASTAPGFGASHTSGIAGTPGTSGTSGPASINTAPTGSNAANAAGAASPSVTGPTGAALGSPAGAATPAGASGLVGVGSPGSQAAAGLGTGVGGVTGAVGQVVATGITAVGETLGLEHPTPPVASAPGTSGAGSSRGSGTSPPSPVTVGGAAGAVATAVSGVTGKVTTALGTAARNLLGTTPAG